MYTMLVLLTAVAFSRERVENSSPSWTPAPNMAAI
jgi:hypothetical protein